MNNHKIALLADVSNYRLDADSLSAIIAKISARGDVVYGKLYNFSDRRDKAMVSIVKGYGFDTASYINDKRSKKSTIDMRIVIDAVRISAINPHISAFCLVVGDGDIVQLLSALKKDGKFVIGSFNTPNEANEKICNEIIVLRGREQSKKTVMNNLPTKTVIKVGGASMRQQTSSIVSASTKPFATKPFAAKAPVANALPPSYLEYEQRLLEQQRKLEQQQRRFEEQQQKLEDERRNKEIEARRYKLQQEESALASERSNLEKQRMDAERKFEERLRRFEEEQGIRLSSANDRITNKDKDKDNEIVRQRELLEQQRQELAIEKENVAKKAQLVEQQQAAKERAIAAQSAIAKQKAYEELQEAKELALLEARKKDLLEQQSFIANKRQQEDRILTEQLEQQRNEAKQVLKVTQEFDADKEITRYTFDDENNDKDVDENIVVTDDEDVNENIVVTNDEVKVDDDDEYDDDEKEKNKDDLAAKLESFANRSSSLNYDADQDVDEKKSLLKEIDEALDEAKDFKRFNPEDIDTVKEVIELMQSVKETVAMSLEE